MLAYFGINAHTKVTTDANPVGLGAVLVQEVEGYRVVSYVTLVEALVTLSVGTVKQEKTL